MRSVNEDFNLNVDTIRHASICGCLLCRLSSKVWVAPVFDYNAETVYTPLLYCYIDSFFNSCLYDFHGNFFLKHLFESFTHDGKQCIS
jgi:hypothetical protein